MRDGFATSVVHCKTQREEFLRITVYQHMSCFRAYFDQIGSESVSAINIVYQPVEFIVGNGFLIFLEHAPFRFAAEDADVFFRLKSRWKDRGE